MKMTAFLLLFAATNPSFADIDSATSLDRYLNQRADKVAEMCGLVEATQYCKVSLEQTQAQFKKAKVKVDADRFEEEFRKKWRDFNRQEIKSVLEGLSLIDRESAFMEVELPGGVEKFAELFRIDFLKYESLARSSLLKPNRSRKSPGLNQETLTKLEKKWARVRRALEADSSNTD